MSRLAALVLLAVELGAGFGDATATVVSTTEQSMIVEVHVVVSGDPGSVVAHFALPGEEQVTVPLLPRDGGGYGVRTELRPADYTVVFEAIGDEPALSEPKTLVELGAELDEVSGPESGGGVGASSESWLWLGVALGAASLSALAFWVLGERSRDPEPAEPAQEPSD